MSQNPEPLCGIEDALETFLEAKMMKTKDERFDELESELNGIIAGKNDQYSSFSISYKPYIDGAKLKACVSRVKKIANPIGVENDLEKSPSNIKIKVIISPK